MQIQDYRLPRILDDALDPQWPIGKAAQHIVLSNFRDMLGFAGELLATCSIESVHKTRVAARRTRAALRAYLGCWPGIKVKGHIKALSRFAGELSRCRDFDVFILFLEPEDALQATAQKQACLETAVCLKRKRAELETSMEGAVKKFFVSGLIEEFLDTYSSAPYNLWAEGEQVG